MSNFVQVDRMLTDIFGKGVKPKATRFKLRRSVPNKAMGRFPKTWADVNAAKATWCEDVDGEGLFNGNVDILIKASWLPEGSRESGDYRIVSGDNLKHALERLKDEFWSVMRPPVELRK